MNRVIIIFLTVLLASCIKEDTTNYYAYLKNTTGHQIKIIPYFSGALVQAHIVTLSPNEKKEIANGSARGLQNNGGFSSPYFSGADSLVVIFDSLYSITHYGSLPATVSRKYYLYSSRRNLGNYLSYQLQAKDISAHMRENTYTFEFVEQDYLDSR